MIRKISDCADFNTITTRPRAVRILDNKVRERLLRGIIPTLEKMEKICTASDIMPNQVKVVEDNAGALVNAINQNESEQEISIERGKFKGKHAQSMERCSCGRQRDVSKRKSSHA